MRIQAVDPESPLFGKIRPGHSLVSINGEEVRDLLDFQFRVADEEVDLLFSQPGGQEIRFHFVDLFPGALGITFEDDPVRTCRCNCVFCFVRQQPRGMRQALYLRDEDYRLSFTHGNYITLSNVSDEELQRIVDQRLSPMYISVHATDDELRRQMLSNKRLKPVLPQLQYLAAGDIQMHTQVVLCPGINDGRHLESTIQDLAELHPAVQSLAIVPVGLTRYRQNLPNLRTHTPEEASEVLAVVERYQKSMLEKSGSRFVWAADEMYLRAGQSVPPLRSYGDMPQWENGVGMLRQTITDFNRRRRYLATLKSDRRVAFLTGRAAGPTLEQEVAQFCREKCSLKLSVIEVENRFWGEGVTISGLLTGTDLLQSAQSLGSSADRVVLPPNCLNDDDLFLDDMALDDFRKNIDCDIVVGQYDVAGTVREAFQ